MWVAVETRKHRLGKADPAVAGKRWVLTEEIANIYCRTVSLAPMMAMDKRTYNYHISDIASKTLAQLEVYDEAGPRDETETEAIIDKVESLVDDARLHESHADAVSILERADNPPEEATEDRVTSQDGLDIREQARRALVNDICWRIRQECNRAIELPFN